VIRWELKSKMRACILDILDVSAERTRKTQSKMLLPFIALI
jgi:hypothetical protein